MQRLVSVQRRTDWDHVIMHWERSEDAGNVAVDQNLGVQTKYSTVVSIIMECVLDGTPKHRLEGIKVQPLHT